jgi:hypothetical protein
VIANPGIRRIASFVTPRQRGVQPRLLTLTAAALERSAASPAEQVFACTAIGARYSPIASSTAGGRSALVSRMTEASKHARFEGCGSSEGTGHAGCGMTWLR